MQQDIEHDKCAGAVDASVTVHDYRTFCATGLTFRTGVLHLNIGWLTRTVRREKRDAEPNGKISGRDAGKAESHGRVSR